MSVCRPAFKLPIRQFPKVSDTTITITTSYPGANADQIKGFITTPIQQAVASTEGIDTLKSTSAQNVSTITMKLRLDADGDRALADVLSKVNEIKSVLPEESNDPVVKRTTGSPYALMYIGFNSKTMTSSQISDYLDRVVRPQLQAINGVASAEILGGATFAMRVWLDPDKMASFAITPLDVANALASNNFTTAAGQVKSDFVQKNINAQTSLEKPEDFANLVVADRGDTIIKLGQIATINLGPQDFESSSSFDGLKAVFMGINVTPDANPLTVIKAVADAMPDIQRQLPAGLEAQIAYDATKFINSSITEVSKTLMEAAVIVIVVIFLFLGNVRSTIIPVVTIPLSLVGVAVLLLALGYSINLLTLLAFVLAIGLVVDDAIVVVENIHRHIEEGMTPFDAALKGAREITGPVVTMTLTLVAVYAPIGFTSGLTGALFREFAFTLAGAVLVSGVIALTLSPMMSSKILKGHQKQGWFSRGVERVFSALRRVYSRMLNGAMKQRPVFAFMLLIIVAMTGILYMAINKELAPAEDQGVLFAFANSPEQTNLDYLTTYTDRANEILREIPERQNIFTINGSGNTHSAFVGLILKPWGERERSDKQIIAELQPKFSGISGIKTFATAPSAIPIGAGEMPVEFVLKVSRRLSAHRRGDGQARRRGEEERPLHLHQHGLALRDAADRTGHRQGSRQQARRDDAGCRHDAGDAARRQLRQSFHDRRAQLPGDPASAADVSRFSRVADTLSGSRDQRGHGAAVGFYQHQPVGSAKQPRHFPAAQFRSLSGRAVPGPNHRRGYRVPAAEGAGTHAAGHDLRLPGRKPAIRARRQYARGHLPLRADRHLSRARGPVRKLPRSRSSS